MKRKIIPLMALCLLLAVGLPALAQVSVNHDLSWHVIAGGGGQTGDAGHVLWSTIGQPLVGPMTSGGHILYGGFWPGSAPTKYPVYLPLVMRNR